MVYCKILSYAQLYMFNYVRCSCTLNLRTQLQVWMHAHCTNTNPQASLTHRKQLFHNESYIVHGLQYNSSIEQYITLA